MLPSSWNRWFFVIGIVFVIVIVSKGSHHESDNIDTLAQAYLDTERNLWLLVRSTNLYDNDNTLIHLYETHEDFLAKHFAETGMFDRLLREPRIQMMEDNRTMERHIWHMVESITYINKTASKVQRHLNRRQYDDIPNIVKDEIFDIMPKTIATLRQFVNKSFWSFVRFDSQICRQDQVFVQSENEVITGFYREIAAAFLKSYILLQMGYMYQTANAFGNYANQSELLREQYVQNVTIIQNDVQFEIRNASRAMWACDPNDFYNQESYIEITRFFQGYIDNEINLNRDGSCQTTCEEHTRTKHYHCGDGSFCKERLEPWEQNKLICNGAVLNCEYIEGDLSICPAEIDSPRRYKLIKKDDGFIMGGEKNCTNTKSITSEAWWSYVVHCSNCFCYCDEPGYQSDRYFSLRSVVSNTRENKIITGVGITKINRIIQFKITERQLLPNGKINAAQNETLWHKWRTAKEFSIDDHDVEAGIDYYALSWPNNRTIDLDTVFDADRVVTGVRFRVVNAHLRLEVRVTNFDFKTGELNDVQHSEWISNNSRQKTPVELKYPDRPTRTPQKSLPVRGKNLSIQFQPSDMLKDAAQSTVPFLDATPVEAPAPLSGVGLYLKAQYGYGGFIAPTLIVFDSSLYMRPINNF